MEFVVVVVFNEIVLGWECNSDGRMLEEQAQSSVSINSTIRRLVECC